MDEPAKLQLVKHVPSANDGPTAATDGRRQRSERSRQQIIEALFKLIDEGNVSPAAADVAEKAGVGLRSVFRHFDDMDSLYREMMSILEAEILPIVAAPLETTGWAAQREELLERRVRIYERLMLYKVAAGLRRFQSDFLMKSHTRFLAVERAGLKGKLPKELADDPARFEAIEASVSFETWRRLRQDQGLDVETATAAFREIFQTMAPA